MTLVAQASGQGAMKGARQTVSPGVRRRAPVVMDATLRGGEIASRQHEDPAEGIGTRLQRLKGSIYLLAVGIGATCRDDDQGQQEAAYCSRQQRRTGRGIEDGLGHPYRLLRNTPRYGFRLHRASLSGGIRDA